MTAPPPFRQDEERRFTTYDGTGLFYRHWPAPDKTGKAVVMFHRGHEHSGRMAHIVRELGLDDFDFFAWDARGHGMSPGERGDAPGIDALVRDMDAFIAHLGAAHGIKPENIIVLAQSVGAVLATAWVHDYAPNIRALILGSPAFKVKLYVPLARRAIALWSKLRGNFFVNSYVKAKFLTHDPERIASFDSDPLITRAISARILTGLFNTSERIVADAAAIAIPVQMFVSEADWVVHHHPQHVFYNRLNHPLNERHVMSGFYHDTFGEKEREQVFSRIRSFIDTVFAPVPARDGLVAPAWPPLLWADCCGASATERKQLETPLPLLSPKGLYYALARKVVRLLGPFSNGMRLGLETGFDSGSTLDYVYRNEVGGTNSIGRILDRVYLESPGWTGIRARKELLEELLALGARKLREAGRPVRIMDVAAGHGRYVLDTLETLGHEGWDSALLRDFSPLNVELGRERVQERGLTDKVRFMKGDAFDAENLASVTPEPTLAVVSGLYELFPENDPVLASLKGIAGAVREGGYLVYTNQPWHPQQEFIARVLTSHRDGIPWVMRCRSQAEMDCLVAQAGFEKMAQRIDPQGIFTVSLARRRAVLPDAELQAKPARRAGGKTAAKAAPVKSATEKPAAPAPKKKKKATDKMPADT